MMYNCTFEKIYKAVSEIENKEANFKIELESYVDMDEYQDDKFSEFVEIIREAFQANGISVGHVEVEKYMSEEVVLHSAYALNYSANDDELNIYEKINDVTIFYLLKKRLERGDYCFFNNRTISAVHMKKYGFITCRYCGNYAFINMESKTYKKLANYWREEIIDKNMCRRIDEGKNIFMKTQHKSFPLLKIKCTCGKVNAVVFPEPKEFIVSPLDYIDRFERDNLHTWKLQ